MTEYKYDAFFSYNRKDGPLVKQIAKELINEGINVWFDESNLKWILKWKKAIEKAIKDSSSVIVFIGTSGIGKWQKIEVKMALSLYKKQKIPVIPVILPGVMKPKLPRFLQGFNWVDLRLLNLEKLIEAITRRKPPKPTIMLVDFEVKLSTSIKMIVEEICKKYNEPEIYFGVFGALTEKTDLVIRGFEDLKSADNLSKLDIKDYFIACTMHLPGIEPPLGLR